MTNIRKAQAILNTEPLVFGENLDRIRGKKFIRIVDETDGSEVYVNLKRIKELNEKETNENG